MTVRTPHFAHPFRVVGGKVVEVEQDSAEEIRACVMAILSTRTGSRMEAPDFGIPDELFASLSPNPSAEEIVSAIETWEPRAQVLGRVAIEGMVKEVTIELESA